MQYAVKQTNIILIISLKLKTLQHRMLINKKSTINSFLYCVLFTAYLLLFTAYSFSQTIYEAPKLTCVKNNSIAPANTELNWNLPATANPCFVGYEIYASTGNINGPYLLITTVNNPLQTSIQFNSTIIPTPTSDETTVTHFL